MATGPPSTAEKAGAQEIATQSEVLVWHDGCLAGLESADEFADASIREMPVSADECIAVANTAAKSGVANQLLLHRAGTTETALRNAARLPVSGAVEFNGTADLPIVRTALTRLMPDSVFINLTSGTAYGLAVAERFCDALRHRVALAETKLTELSILLHEASANAILHGNLEVTSSPAATGFPGLQTQYDAIERSLSDDDMRNRRIDLTADWSDEVLNIRITNDGPGYTAKLGPMLKTDAPRRGMELINSLADRVEIDQGGRRLMLSIDL